MKKLLLVLFSIVYLGVYAQKNKNFQLSSHILDISTGRPAPQVEVELEKYNDISKQWVFITKKMTNNNGRITDFLPLIKGKSENHGKYRLKISSQTKKQKVFILISRWFFRLKMMSITMYRLRFRLLDTLLIEEIKIFKEKNIE